MKIRTMSKMEMECCTHANTQINTLRTHERTYRIEPDAVVIKVVDALVAEFAVHRVLRHGHIADPAVLHMLVRRHGPGLPLRIGGLVQTYVPIIASTAFMLLLHQRNGILLVFLPVPTQMHVDGIHQQGLHAKVAHQGHGPKPDQSDGRGRAFG